MYKKTLVLFLLIFLCSSPSQAVFASNEFDDKTARVAIPLWDIDPERRNEPIFINGSYHRFTVFEMLDYYAEKIGLVRQDLKDKSMMSPPWSPKLEQ